MRTYFQIALLFFTQLLIAQEKGLTPVSPGQTSNGETYALVVAISDYQDNKIPDLKYAHKDAHAFARFLRSDAGGNLDEDHLTLLLNEKATMAQFGIALDWLLEVCKEGDQVILYFAGHGDVEKKSFSQSGFLLFWDAPSKVYMSGGTFSLNTLQDVVTTLSVVNKASILFIADACHSGSLAGSGVGGSAITGATLAKQYSNEIKILSCQPDEYSVEGEQWGGGRGAFSFHLLNGLYGLADKNNDYVVSLMEIRNFLEDHVAEEVAPEEQNPMIVGNAKKELFNVYSDLLDKVKSLNDSRKITMGAIASRGIVDDVLALANDDVKKLYKAFNNSIVDRRLLSPKEDCAEYYYQHLIKEESIKKLHSRIRRNFAAALQEEAQQVFNIRLNSDVKGMLHSNKTQEVRYKLCIRYINRAKELLGSDHYMFPILKARQLFFEGYVMSLNYQTLTKQNGQIALNKFRAALRSQPFMPQTYLAMSTIFGHTFEQKDSAIYYANLASEESPTWEMPYTYTAFLLSTKYKDFDKAKSYIQKAEAIDPSSVFVLNTWGNYYLAKEDLEMAKEYFEKCIKEDPSFAPAHSNLGVILMKQGELEKSEKAFQEYLERDPGHSFVKFNLGTVYLKQGRLSEAETIINQCLVSNPDMVDAIQILGNIRAAQNRNQEAIDFYNQCLTLNENHLGALNNKGNVLMKLNRLEEARIILEKSFQLNPNDAKINAQLGTIYISKTNFAKAEKYLTKSYDIDPHQENVLINLGSVYLKKEGIQNAKNVLEKALTINNKNAMTYHLLGETYRMAGDEKASISYFRTSLELNDRFYDSYTQLGRAYAELKNYKKAEEVLKKSVKINKNAFEDQYLRACIKAVMEENKKAYSYLEEALKMGFKDYQKLQIDKAFIQLREDKGKWKKLMKKYFPDK